MPIAPLGAKRRLVRWGALAPRMPIAAAEWDDAWEGAAGHSAKRWAVAKSGNEANQ
jgi:hypothetical protein